MSQLIKEADDDLRSSDMWLFSTLPMGLSVMVVLSLMLVLMQTLYKAEVQADGRGLAQRGRSQRTRDRL